MAKTKKPVEYKNTNVPPAICKGGGLLAHNVGELKALLDLLPDDLAVSHNEFHAMQVTVTNNGPKSPGEPYLTIEETDIDEWEDNYAD